MQKKLRQTLGLFAAAALTLASATSAWADTGRLLTENFSYDAGTELYGQGGWLKVGSNPNDPIKVSQGSLVYQGYMDEPVGNSVKLVDTASGQDLMRFFDNGTKINSGSIYAAMLINVESIQEGTPTYFFGLFPETNAGLADGKSPTEYGRIFAKRTDDAHYHLYVGRSGTFSKTTECAMDLAYGTHTSWC